MYVKQQDNDNNQLHQQVYDSFASVFSQPLYENVKQNTQWRLQSVQNGWATISKASFDDYLSILFSLFISKSKSIRQCWKDAGSLMKTLETEDNMYYEYWNDIHQNICYGSFNSDLTQNSDDIQTEALCRARSFSNLLQQQLNSINVNNSQEIYLNYEQNDENKRQLINFPFISENWMSQTFVFFMRNVLINSFKLFKQTFPLKYMVTELFIQTLVEEIQTRKRKYQDRHQRYQTVIPREPAVKPKHIIDCFKNHHRIKVSDSGRKCISCHCKYSINGCSCHKTHAYCKECYQLHIDELRTSRLYCCVIKRNNMNK
ncbi:Hypothetical_protein [Hexamita inflata]|uniref:Hypothetical_protein n=1 Tax=Hexamita inflata TaxID=28002 RepID=A0AA86QUA2_9EUKA|nr:Hypothetical protein HINF_LOCUS53811 [Hexamita inflata]